MKIHIWNAFASNNSGSYTIVGTFRDASDAAEAAAELTELMRAHTDWLESNDGRQLADSPLGAFAKKHGLHGDVSKETDWPEYSSDNTPGVVAVHDQVIIHHPYTVTLPRLFGEYFYARGGRVSVELDHAHHPVVAVFEVWIPWKERQESGPAKIASFLEALTTGEGLFANPSALPSPPVIKTNEHLMEPPLVIGAVFQDLLEGFKAIADAATGRGLIIHVRVAEAATRENPLAALRD